MWKKGSHVGQSGPWCLIIYCVNFYNFQLKLRADLETQFRAKTGVRNITN